MKVLNTNVKEKAVEKKAEETEIGKSHPTSPLEDRLLQFPPLHPATSIETNEEFEMEEPNTTFKLKDRQLQSPPLHPVTSIKNSDQAVVTQHTSQTKQQK